MWEENAQLILDYMIKTQGSFDEDGTKVPWKGIFLHLEPPVPAVKGQGKPENAYAHPARIAQFISQIPLTFRVGVQAVIESDSTWFLGSGDGYAYTPQWRRFFENDTYWGKGGKGNPGFPTSDCLDFGMSKLPFGSAPTVLCMPHKTLADNDLLACSATLPASFDTANIKSYTYCQPSSARQVATTLGHDSWFLDDASIAGPKTCWCIDYLKDFTAGPAIQWDASSGNLWRNAKDDPITPGYAGFQTPETAVWHGGAGASGWAPTSPTGSGAPYQAVTDPVYGRTQACPDQATGPDGSWPAGCPNNPAHMAWYVALINLLLRRMGSKQQIDMVNWDKEDNGPIGYQCTAFQFLYAMRQFGTKEDVKPLGRKWLLFENSGPEPAPKPAGNPAQACGDWMNTNLNLIPEWDAVEESATLTNFGDMAAFVAAPEFYWFNGEDMGNNPPGTAAKTTPARLPGDQDLVTGLGGMLQSLVEDGYVGCPQSESAKVGFDANCGCRGTPYEYAATTDDPAMTLLSLLEPVYQQYTYPNVMPTFSIEHLGPSDTMLQFGLCVNSQNFANFLADNIGAGKADTLCAANTKCTARCGVANFFGNWQQKDFFDFLRKFFVNYGCRIQTEDVDNPGQSVARLCVYDMGFLPTAWITGSKTDPTFTGKPNLVPANSPPPVTTADSLNLDDTGIVDWLTQCPAWPGDPCNKVPRTLYMCASVSDPAYAPLPSHWEITQDSPGNPSPATLQCYNCGEGCVYEGGVVGGLGFNNQYQQTPEMCSDSKSTCGTVPDASAPGMIWAEPVCPTSPRKRKAPLAGAGLGGKKKKSEQCKGEGCRDGINQHVTGSTVVSSETSSTGTSVNVSSSTGNKAGMIAGIVILIIIVGVAIGVGVWAAKRTQPPRRV